MCFLTDKGSMNRLIDSHRAYREGGERGIVPYHRDMDDAFNNRSAVFAPEVAAPAARPVATVLASGLPIFMLVVSQPLNSSAAPAASSRVQDFLLFNIRCSPVKGRP